ncbi:DNA damage-binding protein 1 [Plasmodiophora brassicae]|uniref:DNA damage-binding protein 1 n=1 Tax=Plasmodiophora brassicae TaxID=37360 RepID=A0A3P3YDT9_PLABS|nr:unnamed protein product [Plasmodiophora brassicae]
MATPYQYVVTALAPTAVTHAAVCDFTGERNLVLGRCTRFQVYALTKSSLRLEADLPVFGRLAVLRPYRPRRSDRDWVVIVTERLQFAVIAYDEATRQIVTKASGSCADKIGRLTDNGLHAEVDPTCRVLAMHAYDGLLKVVPLSEGGTRFGTAFNMRLDELQLVAMCFLHVDPKDPITLLVLFEDTRHARHLRSYTVDLEMRDLKRSTWDFPVQATASKIEALPLPRGGALIFSDTSITCHIDGKRSYSTTTSGAAVKAVGRIDEDGSRYLVGDCDGRLFVLSIDTEGTIDLDMIGHVSQPSSLSYLDNGFVFVGSVFGDAQLIRLTAEPDASGEFVDVIEDIPQIGPITDMAIIKPQDRCGQSRLITCSGTFADGSLRTICNGIGVEAYSSLPVRGLVALFSVRSADATYLVQSFVSETRVVRASLVSPTSLEFAEIENREASPFLTEPTLYCGNMRDDRIVQCTTSSVRVVGGSTWQPCGDDGRMRDGMDADITICHAKASLDTIILALNDNTLARLSVGKDGSIVEHASRPESREISCLDVDDEFQLVATASWSSSCVSLLSLPDLETVDQASLPYLARSISIVRFGPARAPIFVLCGLGDGSVVTFSVDKGSRLSAPTRVIIGTHPVSLTPFTSHGTKQVFVSCDRPTLISAPSSGAGGDLAVISVNLKDVTCMAPLEGEPGFPEACVVLGSPSDVTIGALDAVQRWHIRKVPLRQQPRRIAHHPPSHTLLVLTLAVMDEANIERDEEPPEQCYIKLYDDQTFEELQSVPLLPFECGSAVAQMTLDGLDVFIVGTAFEMPDEDESSAGRLMAYRIDSERRRLQLDTQKRVNGGVYAVEPFSGGVLGTINNKICLFRRAAELADDDDGDAGIRAFAIECSHIGQVFSTHLKACGDLFIVGDLMKSVTLMAYDSSVPALRELARDASQNWVVCLQVLDDSTYIVANNSHNLMTLARNVQAIEDDQRAQLDVVGRFHLGQFVNSIRRGSLIVDQDLDVCPQFLFGTISGMIGVTASLSESQYALLNRVEASLRGLIGGLGGFKHEFGRAFQNVEGYSDVIPSHNYVDGDLIEMFLDLDPALQQKVAGDVGVARDDLHRQIERLSRIH